MIKNLHRRLSVNEQRTTATALQANVSRANINALQQSVGTVPSGLTVQGQIGTVPAGKSLQSQINDLYSRIGDPGDTGSQGLTQAKSQFLAGLSVLNPPALYPLSTDPNSGSSWASGERVYLNDVINALNTLISHLQANGFSN